MNGQINSRNFKATFTIEDNKVESNIVVTGLNTESRKYLKSHATPLTNKNNPSSIVAILQGHEIALRAYVLAKIGG